MASAVSIHPAIAKLVPNRTDTVARLWRSIRILRHDIDVGMLALAAAAPEPSTRAYVNLLFRSGYLVQSVKPDLKRKQTAKYALVRNSGPLAPRRAITVMADPNTGDVFALPPLRPKAKHKAAPLVLVRRAA